MARIDPNDLLQFHDGEYLVTEHWGSLLKLRNVDTRQYSTIHISELADRLVEPPEKLAPHDLPLSDTGANENRGLTESTMHLVEMLTGERTGFWQGTPARPEYDPALHSLNSRIDSKILEMKNLGQPISRSTLLRQKRDFERAGAHGLVDARTLRRESPLDRADSRILDAIATVIASEVGATSGTKSRLVGKVREELTRAYPGAAIELPSESTMNRYINYLDKGKYTTGNAANRRSAANTPKRPFGTTRRMRPGQEVQVDSTPIDLLVLDSTGRQIKVALTIMVDVATRSIIGSSFSPVAAKGSDHAFVLAQTLAPRRVRPGHREAWRLTSQLMPWAELMTEEEREDLDTTRPFIYPEQIMMDNGRDFRSRVFEAACLKLGIGITLSSPHTPTDKAIVERTFHSLKTLFFQHLPGYKGGTLTERGLNLEGRGLLDVFSLAEAFDEWVARVWQNRPHSGLRDPRFPGVTMSPNEMYSAVFDLSAGIPVPLTRDDFIELLPVEFRRIDQAGVQISNRRYDSPELQPFRQMPSNNASQKNKWEVRIHPYDPRLVWVRHPDQHWMECRWKDDATFLQPHVGDILQNAFDVAQMRNPDHGAALLAISADIQKQLAAQALKSQQSKTRNLDAITLIGATGIPMPEPTLAPQEPFALPHATDFDEDDLDDELNFDGEDDDMPDA